MEIIPFSDELTHHFTNLNKAWLEKYFVIEPIDSEMLSDPKRYFIDGGGYIFFARVNDEIAGTVALIKNSDTIFELSKMAVWEKYQGQKIGHRLMEHCIDMAKELKAEKLVLYSNTILQPAIHLYRKYGFVEVPITNSGYIRSNIKMQLDLN